MASDELGSLSQKVRKDSLRSARITMFAVGVLTIGANLFFGLYAAQMVDKEIEGMRKTGVVIDEAELKPLRETAIRATQLSSFVFVGLGAIFIALGCFVYKAPVACTVTALVLYLGGWMATVAISVAGEDGADVAKALMSGVIVKIFIILCLVRAIQAAVAYQKESKLLANENRDLAL